MPVAESDEGSEAVFGSENESSQSQSWSHWASTGSAVGNTQQSAKLQLLCMDSGEQHVKKRALEGLQKLTKARFRQPSCRTFRDRTRAEGQLPLATRRSGPIDGSSVKLRGRERPAVRGAIGPNRKRAEASPPQACSRSWLKSPAERRADVSYDTSDTTIRVGQLYRDEWHV